jgi:uncharacterized protein YjbJ (UPF0337 family)
MNWDQLEGQWKQMGSEVKATWAKFTDDDLKMIAAKRDKLVGKIQERYGLMKAEAEAQVDRWMKDLDLRHRGATTRDPKVAGSTRTSDPGGPPMAR